MTHSYKIVAKDIPTFRDAWLAEKNGDQYIVSYADAINETVVIPVAAGLDPQEEDDLYAILSAGGPLAGLYSDGPSKDEALERYEAGDWGTDPTLEILDVDGFTFLQDLYNYPDGRLYQRNLDGQKLITSNDSAFGTAVVIPVLGSAVPEDVDSVLAAGMASGKGALLPQFFLSGTDVSVMLSRYTGKKEDAFKYAF